MIELARRFGADPAFVRAGGGNSSAKVDRVLYIKPSGVPLAELTEDALIALAIEPLLGLLDRGSTSGPLPGSDEVLRVAESARLSPADRRRPSVELLFHALLPEPIVLHTHPTAINALTCCRGERALADRIVGDEALWVPYTDPGLPLARAIRAERSAHQERTGGPAPRAILLQNHGLIVSGESASEIDALSREIGAQIADHAPDGPAVAGQGGAVGRPDGALAGAIGEAIVAVLRSRSSDADPVRVVVHDDSSLALDAAGSDLGRQVALDGPLTPDQIVYAGSWPLIIDPTPTAASAATAVRDAMAARTNAGVEAPIIVLVAGVGLFAAGATAAQAGTARDVYLDAMRIAVGAHRLGGIRPLAPAERLFIERWEAEAYRRQVASTAG
ncbi:MAG TPA: class II aldolase/adducin family protein [Patescibacteria group bacterium]|nr:class II aldolase/adducin family protein [Patescibacteria group bacterium]